MEILLFVFLRSLHVVKGPPMWGFSNLHFPPLERNQQKSFKNISIRMKTFSILERPLWWNSAVLRVSKGLCFGPHKSAVFCYIQSQDKLSDTTRWVLSEALRRNLGFKFARS